MNIRQLETAFDLQKRAYGLLLWAAGQGSHLLNEEAMNSTMPCVQWLKHNWNVIPIQYRPESAHLESFAKMLTSFFNTSFHLEVHNGTARLLRGRKFKDGRNRKYATGRAAEAAVELSRVAIASLLKDENIDADDEIVSRILKDDSLAEKVNLWAYGCELVRRSQFASQGPAVHKMWLELDEKKRKRLNAEEVWKARTILINELKRKENEQC